MDFIQEELAVMRSFDGSCRLTLMSELRQALPDVYQPDNKRVMESATAKLDAMSDEEFDAQGFDADRYGSGWGDSG